MVKSVSFCFGFFFGGGVGRGHCFFVFFFPCAAVGLAVPVTVFVLSESLQLGGGKVHIFSG